MALVTLEQVDRRLKLDLDMTLSGSPPVYVDERVADIQFAMEQATDIVIDYIKKPDHEWTSADVPGGISAAIILVIAALFDDFQQAQLLAALSGNDLNNPVVALLYRYRDPALS